MSGYNTLASDLRAIDDNGPSPTINESIPSLYNQPALFAAGIVEHIYTHTIKREGCSALVVAGGSMVCEVRGCDCWRNIKRSILAVGGDPGHPPP